MPEPWESFQKDLDNKKKKDFADFSDSTAKANKKKLITKLDEAWKKEDELRDKIIEAHRTGNSGNKPADFAHDDGYKTALKAWKSAVSAFRDEVESLKSYSDSAAKHLKSWQSEHKKFDKDSKKNKDPSAKTKINDALKASSTAISDLDAAQKIFGTLTVPQVFYAAKLNDTIDAIVKTTMKKATDTGLPDFLEDPQRTRTGKAVKRMEKNIKKFCKDATQKAASSPEEAQKILKKALDEHKSLQSLNKEHQLAKKKSAKIIAKHVQSAKMKSAIDDVESTLKKCDDMIEKAEKIVDKAEEDADTDT
ncbi:hypothetical protein QO034_06900 [Sedimentitalea sp. JM2-8]|uniref:Uncharacterized protein n=1 Tax=Sedimentitalea xiamensis TaxID=3050037 RepID=A0ABT7FCI7_9RHOB|nr:hypothetical protein [Sedimentitalea xiamensis]MDK3072832.1 hypothetical protein [Sedimentitalea xiamensis]